ncbi:CDP-alcohol phosphatidyltransferase family protein [Actinomadura yumaensis]|uniref:CDP-alcohol phosphatidyltransferase family protein n=1 Tax=Actinomadura yumaensis TaxID=111807 RepID=UPI003615B1DF
MLKPADGLFATYAVGGYSPAIARWAAERGLTPNTVTAMSLGSALLAAVWFAGGTRGGMVAGGLLLYLAFVLDCVDGQLARLTRSETPLGAWLDAISDRIKEYAAYFGLAVGSTTAAAGSLVHSGNVWGLATAAMVLQAIRHLIGFSFLERGGGTGAPPTEAAPDPYSGTGGDGRDRALYWARKAIVLPIGERFALISVTAAVTNARVTFLALLAWGGVAAAYGLAVRMNQALRAPKAAAP